MTAPVRHRDHCTAPQPTRYLGRYGDTLLRCPDCRAFVVVEDDAPTTATALTPPRPRSSVLARYRCREHGTPVTWKGTGCRPCTTERTHRRTRPAQEDE